MTRQRILAVVGLVSSVFFVWLVLRKTDFEAVRASLEQAALGLVALSLVTKTMGFVFMSLRTRVLLGTDSEVSTLFRGHLSGFAGNNILPFRLGELIKINYIATHLELPRAQVLAVAGLEKLFDLFVLAVFFATVTPLVLGDVPIEGSFVAFVVALIGAMGTTLVISRHPERFVDLITLVLKPFGKRIQGFFLSRSRAFAEGMSSLASLRRVGMAFTYSLGYWSMSILGLQILLAAFNLALPWYAPFFITGLLAFGSALPSAPGFVGTWHYMCRLALVSLGVAEGAAVAFAIAAHFMAVVPYTLIAIMVLGLSTFRLREHQPADQAATS